MKLNKLIVGILVIIFGLSAFIVWPGLNINIAGKQINNDFNHYFDFANSRDFVNQTKFKFEFQSLDESTAEADFNRNMNIIKQRIEILGLNDYQLQYTKNAENKYGFEIYLPNDSTNYNFALSTIVGSGQPIIYQDIENFEPSVDESQNFNFLDGKQPSPLLSVNDIVSASTYFDATLGQTGGFVIRTEFGNNKIENITSAARATDSTKITENFKGIWLVMDSFPIAFQSRYIQKAENGIKGDSHIMFTPLGDSFNAIQVKAIASLLMTNPIDTNIQMTGTQTINPIVDNTSVNYMKLALPASLVIFALMSLIFTRKKGLYLVSAAVVNFVVLFAVTKLASESASLGLGRYTIIAVVFSTLAMISTVYLGMFDESDGEIDFDKFKKSYISTRYYLFWTALAIFAAILLAGYAYPIVYLMNILSIIEISIVTNIILGELYIRIIDQSVTRKLNL